MRFGQDANNKVAQPNVSSRVQEDRWTTPEVCKWKINVDGSIYHGRKGVEIMKHYSSETSVEIAEMLAI